MALKYALNGKQLRGSVTFDAATEALVQIPTGGFSGTDYSISLVAIAANAAALPTKYGISDKNAGSFKIVTQGAFTGSFDILVTG